jgi:alkylation response protein AidB-like acyl-CoA dehydrogenase
MDFNFSEEQLALRDLAREILEAEVTPEHLKAIEQRKDGYSAPLWSKLADANLLGLAVPENLSGMGFGIVELCLLLQEVGRAVAPIPALPTLVLGALPIARFGTDAQKERFLPSVANGQTLLSAALVDADSSDIRAPATRARHDGSGWRLDGRKRFVSAAQSAERIVVPAVTDAGLGLFLLDPNTDGVTLSGGKTSTHQPIFELTMSGARVDEADLLGGEIADRANATAQLAWLCDCALVAISATQIGVCERALEITTHYVSERQQFNAPIGSFPAVQHRSADCYIDITSLRWITWRAAWKLASGLDATRDAGIAKFFAAEAGARVGTAVQHLHGGMGADRDYPIHRYFLWSKSLELNLGSAMPQLAALGRDMARTGPQEFL